MKKTVKTVNPTLVPVEPSKNEYPLQHYKLMQSWTEAQADNPFFEKLADELINWVEGDESRIFTETFYRYKYINQKQFWDWLNRSEVLRKAYEYAKGVMAERKQRGLAKFNYAMAVTPTMGHYSDIWDEQMKAKAAAHKQDIGDTNITVEMRPEEKTQIVALAKEKRAIANGKKDSTRALQTKRVSKTTP
jgi:uncharacterized membrane-anchored protein YjiN (DUF445 family)